MYVLGKELSIKVQPYNAILYHLNWCIRFGMFKVKRIYPERFGLNACRKTLILTMLCRGDFKLSIRTLA